MNGTYREHITFFNATLEVSKTEYRICFYYPGPDLRHKGHWDYINGKDIDSYIEALNINYDTYNEF